MAKRLKAGASTKALGKWLTPLFVGLALLSTETPCDGCAVLGRMQVLPTLDRPLVMT